MPTPYWQLAVRSEFSAAHALRHYKGKCENPHGHNFSVEIRVQGSELEPKTEFLIDYKVLKTELDAVLKSLDHKNLNEIQPFDTLNPSSENLSRHVYRELAPRLPAQVRLVSVTVGEKEGQTATYFSS